jgi:hypothetical protein
MLHERFLSVIDAFACPRVKTYCGAINRCCETIAVAISKMRQTLPYRAILRACHVQQNRRFHFRHTAHAPITPRSTNFSQWYLDIIASSDLAESSPVKVWENVTI